MRNPQEAETLHELHTHAVCQGCRPNTHLSEARLQLVQQAAAAELAAHGARGCLQHHVQQQREVSHARALPRRQLAALPARLVASARVLSGSEHWRACAGVHDVHALMCMRCNQLST